MKLTFRESGVYCDQMGFSSSSWEPLIVIRECATCYPDSSPLCFKSVKTIKSSGCNYFVCASNINQMLAAKYV